MRFMIALSINLNDVINDSRCDKRSLKSKTFTSRFSWTNIRFIHLVSESTEDSTDHCSCGNVATITNWILKVKLLFQIRCWVLNKTTLTSCSWTCQAQIVGFFLLIASTFFSMSTWLFCFWRVPPIAPGFTDPVSWYLKAIWIFEVRSIVTIKVCLCFMKFWITIFRVERVILIQSFFRWLWSYIASNWKL